MNLVIPFRGPSTLATFVAVYALFGPTFPGIYDKDRGVYTLFYPVCMTYITVAEYFLISLLSFSLYPVDVLLQGLSFAFPIPSQYTECCHDREGIGFYYYLLLNKFEINSHFLRLLSSLW